MAFFLDSYLYLAGRVYGLCVFFISGAQGSGSGEARDGKGLIHYNTAASSCIEFYLLFMLSLAMLSFI